jgi:hypothetical protein
MLIVPQLSFAAFVDPGAIFMGPEVHLSKIASGVGLKIPEYLPTGSDGSYYSMDVICSDT